MRRMNSEGTSERGTVMGGSGGRSWVAASRAWADDVGRWSRILAVGARHLGRPLSGRRRIGPSDPGCARPQALVGRSERRGTARTSDRLRQPEA